MISQTLTQPFTIRVPAFGCILVATMESRPTVSLTRRVANQALQQTAGQDRTERRHSALRFSWCPHVAIAFRFRAAYQRCGGFGKLA